MALRKISSLILSLIVFFFALISAVPISQHPSQFSGTLPPAIRALRAFSPSLPAVPTSMAPPQYSAPPPMPIAFPPTLAGVPTSPALPALPTSMPPSQDAAPPQMPIACPPSLPGVPTSSSLLGVPTSVPPSQYAPPPQMPIAFPPSLPAAPTSMPPSQYAGPPQMPIAFPPAVPAVPTSMPPSQYEAPPQVPIAFPPSLPPVPTAMPPSQYAAPPQMPITYPPTLPIALPPTLPPIPSISPSRGIKGAYWPSGQAETFPPSGIPTSYFTHVFYAFLLVDATSFQLLITEFDHQWMPNFTFTLHAANPPAKALLSIGGAGADSQIFSNMVTNCDNRAAFIQSTIDTARRYSFDGLDLDWENPKNPEEMSNLALLYKEWRAAINHDSIISGKPRLLLSSAVYFASHFFIPGDVARTYPGNAISTYVDFVNPMCYDYHGGWDPYETGALALLYDKSSNVSTSYGISSWKGDGVLSKKLVMGMPAYGRTWELKDSNQHAIGAPAVGIGPGGGVMVYSDIVGFNSENNATVVFDNATVSTYSYSGTSWIGYDDPTSVQYKVKFAKDQGLGGYFFWALGFDSNWDLARAASEAWDCGNC